jgi:hypothetical protein
MQIPMQTTILCQATGYLRGNEFAGLAVMQQVMQTSALPDPIVFHGELKFTVRVDNR